MDRSEQPLAPQWLKGSGNNSTWSAANHRHGSSLLQSEKDAYSNFRRNANKNRSYSSSGRSQHISDKRTHTNDINDKRIISLCDHKQHNNSGSLDSVFPFRSEKDASKQSNSVILQKSGERWRRKVPSDLNNDDQSNNSKDDHPVTGGAADTVNKISFEHEFPSLVSEDEQGCCERGQLSSGLSTIIQHFPVGNLADSGNNSLASTLVRAPVTDGSNSMTAALTLSSPSTSSVPIASSIIGRNMAEMAQVPARFHTPPQLKVETQKLEELAIKQSRQLVPLTPSALSSLVVSPTEKSKFKIGQQQQPFLRVANHSPRGHPTKLDSPKTSLVNLSVLGASKEFGGFSTSAKSTLIANKSTIMNGTNRIVPSRPGPFTSKKPNNLESPAQMTLERRLTSQAQSRNDFFKNLSRKTSSTSMSSNLPRACSNTLPSEFENFQTPQIVTSITLNGVHVPSLDASVLNSTNESSSLITQENASCADEKTEKKSSTNFVLYPDEKEAAFLRSLGWEENTEDDGGLTEEEINEFWDKVTCLLKGLKKEEIVAYCNKPLHMKLKPLSEILDKLFPKMMLVKFNSNERSCNGASPQLSSSS